MQTGDEVKVLSYGQKGTLIEKVSDKEWIVQIGILKMKLDQSGLEYVKPEKEKKQYVSTSVRGRDSHVKLELDLRGERYEDAIFRTEKYLDDAILIELSPSFDYSWKRDRCVKTRYSAIFEKSFTRENLPVRRR